MGHWGVDVEMTYFSDITLKVVPGAIVYPYILKGKSKNPWSLRLVAWIILVSCLSVPRGSGSRKDNLVRGLLKNRYSCL